MTLTTAQLRKQFTGAEPTPTLTRALSDLLVSADDVEPPLTVGEVADLLGVSAHTLRWYERIGLVAVDRDAAGRRSYDRDAIGRVVFITRLRMADMPIEDIRRYVELVGQGDGTRAERRRMLADHRTALRRRIEELEFAAAVIDYKLAEYDATN